MAKSVQGFWFIFSVLLAAILIVKIESLEIAIILSFGSFIGGKLIIREFIEIQSQTPIGKLQNETLAKEDQYWVSGNNDAHACASTVFICVKDLEVRRQISQSVKNFGCHSIECDSFSAIEVLLSSGGKSFKLLLDSGSLSENIFLMSDINDLKSASINCEFIALLRDDEIANLSKEISDTFDSVVSMPRSLDEVSLIVDSIFPEDLRDRYRPTPEIKRSHRISSPIPVGYRKIVPIKNL